MEKERQELSISSSVITVTKCLMERYSLSYEFAFKKLIGTMFYDILNDYESGLCLEPGWYVCKACLLELEEGRDKMIEYINNN
ncbi:MAG: hypothetical protein LUD47_05705 [Clostridia bacterium]|nr:hypothetical protein [Clostridia bacterium]